MLRQEKKFDYCFVILKPLNMKLLTSKKKKKKKTGENSFQESTFLLTKSFGERGSLFNAHWQHVNLIKKDSNDYTTITCVVNREYEKFKLSEHTPDMFKYLIYIKTNSTKKQN